MGWDERFVELAKHIAQWSKDPSTKTGCVLADPRNRIVSLGFNGFPRGIADDDRLDDRETKYKMVVHAEINALLFASSPTDQVCAYMWPWPPCGPCASALIQGGIRRVVAPAPTDQQKVRWGKDFLIMESLFREAGVVLQLIHSP